MQNGFMISGKGVREALYQEEGPSKVKDKGNKKWITTEEQGIITAEVTSKPVKQQSKEKG